MRETASFDRNIDMPSSQPGNAMIYILVALALVGFLTITLTRQSNQDDGQDLSEEQAELYTLELMEYASATAQTIEMMRATGSNINDLDFVAPADAAFNTGSHIHKVFHPQGGGLNYQSQLSGNIGLSASSTWYFQNNLNVEWTSTTALDGIIMAYNIKRDICETMNKSITGSVNIPAATVGLNAIFDPGSYTETAFDTVNCPGCDGYSTLCISNGSVDTYGFYSIIAAQ